MEKYILNELKIEVTYYCPLACVHCSSNAHENNTLSMSPNICFSILEDAYKLGAKKIAFSGGEPLCWEGLDEMIVYCHSKDILSTIYTSGNITNIEDKIEILAKCGLNRAVFSLYSHIESEHNRITRKRNSFSNTIKAIKVAQRHNIDTEIHFVIMKENYLRLPQVVQLAESIGVESISILRFVPQGRGRLMDRKGILNINENKKLREIILKLKKEGYDIRTGSPWNVLYLNENPECKAAKDRMIISPNLRIYPCDAFKQIEYEELVPKDEYSTLENNSLIECWNNSKYLNVIRTQIESLPSQPCADCTNYSICGSGCLAQKYIKYGMLDKNPDPICIRGVI